MERKAGEPGFGRFGLDFLETEVAEGDRHRRERQSIGALTDRTVGGRIETQCYAVGQYGLGTRIKVGIVGIRVRIDGQ